MLRRSCICFLSKKHPRPPLPSGFPQITPIPIKTPICVIGYGNIGRGVVPMLERHFDFDHSQLHVVEPLAAKLCTKLPERGVTNVHAMGLTPKNFQAFFDKVFQDSQGGDAVDGSIRGHIVNCSVDISSVDVAEYANKNNLLYLDTVVEPWKGYYWDKSMTTAQRSNYALREQMLALKRRVGGKGSTCVSCVGANPGMVSWFAKEALLQLAKDTNVPLLSPNSSGNGSNGTQKKTKPTTREEWANLMMRLGVKGVHIAERDTQRAKLRKPIDSFWNTWSVEGFLSEGFQPAELGWGTHERWLPENGKMFDFGCRASIYLEQPGAATRVRTWCPTIGPQFGYLVTHNEAISLADYFTVPSRDPQNPVYRPTAHYAYHPCEEALLSFHEVFGRGNQHQTELKVLFEHDIAGGFDELGVLLYGHAKNALWMGSTLSHEHCVSVITEQNATALQVTSAMIAAHTWALQNPQCGVLEAEELDHNFCLSVQRPYLGKVWHQYTDWTPLQSLLPTDKNWSMFQPPARTDLKDPWQFANVLV